MTATKSPAVVVPPWNSAPAKDAKVGVSISGGRWLPMVAEKLLPDGTMVFRVPGHDQKLTLGLKLSWTDWKWMYAHECRFVKPCPDCRGYGTVYGSAPVKVCDRCVGSGKVPNLRPFDT